MTLMTKHIYKSIKSNEGNITNESARAMACTRASASHFVSEDEDHETVVEALRGFVISEQAPVKKFYSEEEEHRMAFGDLSDTEEKSTDTPMKQFSSSEDDDDSIVSESLRTSPSPTHGPRSFGIANGIASSNTAKLSLSEVGATNGTRPASFTVEDMKMGDNCSGDAHGVIVDKSKDKVAVKVEDESADESIGRNFCGESIEGRACSISDIKNEDANPLGHIAEITSIHGDSPKSFRSSQRVKINPRQINITAGKCSTVFKILTDERNTSKHAIEGHDDSDNKKMSLPLSLGGKIHFKLMEDDVVIEFNTTGNVVGKTRLACYELSTRDDSKTNRIFACSIQGISKRKRKSQSWLK